ncbi:MAG: uncharacterized protein QG622_1108 [Actinomycetota bacterium]|nr:uncharacterized protein [Actinomycetota bacterium]
MTGGDRLYHHDVLFPAIRHEVSFWHGNHRLDGDLVLPPGAGPHPVLLVVADPSLPDRDYSPWLDGLAGHGIASFTWDRGTSVDGAGDPRRRTVDHAREVLSAMDRLRSAPEVDATAIGLAGWGEGGWAAAQAVTFSDRARLLVLAGTPTTEPFDLVEHRILGHLRAAGYAGYAGGGGDDGDAADGARDAVRCWIEGRAEGLSPAELDAGLARWRAEPWFGELGVAVEETAAAKTLTMDPLPTLSAVSVPLLALFGEQDPLLPLARSVRSLGEALHVAGNTDHRIAVVRDADRALRVRPGHGLGRMVDGLHQFGEWPSGLTDVIAEWLVARLCEPGDVPAFAPPADALLVRPRLRVGPVSTGHAPVRQVRRRISR